MNYHDIYLGLFNSANLGNLTDDYMGCDTLLASAFVYNGDNFDDHYPTKDNYGLNPPTQNIVFLKGMEADVGDMIDNNLNGVIDELGERTTMNHFIETNGPSNSLEIPVK